MGVSAQPVPILSDNYAWLLRDRASGATAIVDPAEAGPIEAAIDRAGGRLDLILLTHHHADHVGATEPIRARYGARVVGAKADAHRLPRLDRAVAEGDIVLLGDSAARVIETPGHTRGHIAYFFPEGAGVVSAHVPGLDPGIAGGPVLACGDTLFSLGCGRLFEGTAAEMFKSLGKLAALPAATQVCCGHEYTASNARFALHADPGNRALNARIKAVARLRAAGTPTVPSRMGDELAENPFLRAPDVAAFADLRARKDKF